MGGAYMSEIIEQAKQRLDYHRREVKKLEEFLRTAGEISGTNVEFNDFQKQEPEETKPPVYKPVEKRRLSSRGGASPREIVEIMRRVIRETGRPLTRGEIVDALEARDVDLPATDKNRYIGTIAWRFKAFFTHIDGRGYWVADEPVKDWWRKSYEPTREE